ncbi:MAG: DUF4376 domain-containing protein [Shimia sp.]
MIKIERVAESSLVERSEKRQEENRAVTVERDRRIAAGFSFNGHRFDFDADSVANITGAGASAGIAVALDAELGDLRWADADTDFVWITADNMSVEMDANTCFEFSQAAMAHKRSHIFAARALKDLDELPADWRADTHWPPVST